MDGLGSMQLQRTYQLLDERSEAEYFALQAEVLPLVNRHAQDLFHQLCQMLELLLAQIEIGLSFLLLFYQIECLQGING